MNKLKLATAVVALVAAVYFGERAYSYVKGVLGENARLHVELVGQTEKYQQLSAHAAKLEIQYADQQKLREELEKRFAAEKDALTGRLKILSNATYLIREAARKAGNSDLIHDGDQLHFVVNEIRFNDGPPLGYVLIFDDGRVVSKVYKHEIQVNTAVSRNEETGKYDVVSKADFILKSPSLRTDEKWAWTNRPYPLKITGGTAIIDPTERNHLAPRFHWWAPHFSGGVSAVVGASGVSVRPVVDFSFLGFGPSKNDLDWKFAHLGFDVDSELTDPGAHLTLFSYRFWPSVLSNTFVGPAVGWSRSGPNVQLGVNLTF